MAARSGHGPIIGVEVRSSRHGYSLFLRTANRLSPIRLGRRVRRWPDLDRAVAFLVAHYGVLPIRLRLRGERRSRRVD